MGDAISHALPSSSAFYMIGMNYFIGAVLTGVITAVGIGFVSQNSRIKHDMAIGIMFTSVFAGDYFNYLYEEFRFISYFIRERPISPFFRYVDDTYYRSSYYWPCHAVLQRITLYPLLIQQWRKVMDCRTNGFIMA